MKIIGKESIGNLRVDAVREWILKGVDGKAVRGGGAGVHGEQ